MTIEIKKCNTIAGDVQFKIYTNGSYYDMFPTEAEAIEVFERLKANVKKGLPNEEVLHTYII